MTNTKLENLAHQLAGMNFGKPRDQAAREMYQLIGHLDRRRQMDDNFKDQEPEHEPKANN